MTINAQLSRKLYETLGDEAANAMVDWMHQMDAQRAELRELNELNVSRLEARLAQVDARFEQVDARFDRVEARLDRVEARLDGVDSRLGQLQGQMNDGFARLEIKLERTRADLMKWSFVFWVGSVMTLVGALATLNRLFP